MNDEKLTILRMVEQGQLTAEEGLRLLNAIKESGVSQNSNKAVRIKLLAKDKKKQIFKINLPLSIAKSIHQLIPDKIIEEGKEKGVDLNQIFDDIENFEHKEVADLDIDHGKKIIIEVI